MRALLVLLVVVSGCSEPAYPLPTIGTVGRLPSPSNSVVVEITAEGHVLVGGVRAESESDPEAIGRMLAEASADMPTEDRTLGTVPVTLSTADIVVRAHPDAPASSLTAIQWACARNVPPAHPRLFLEVRHSGDGDRGALAWFLPYDRGIWMVPVPAREIELLLPPGDLRLNARAVAERMREVRGEVATCEDVVVSIVRAPATHVQTVLDAADAAFRAGLLPVVGNRPENLPDLPTMRTDRRGFEPLALGAEDPGAAPPRAHDGYAGIAELCQSPVLPDEVFDEPIPDRQPTQTPDSAEPR